MAVGADTSQVLMMVMRQAMTLVAIGLAIGVTSALVFARLVTRLLFGLSAIDPATFAGVCVLLVLSRRWRATFRRGVRAGWIRFAR